MDDIRIDGLTADEWEELANPQAPTDEQLQQLGIVQENPQQAAGEPTKEEKPQQAERQDYEKLGYWDTVKDEATAGLVELSKFFVPKDKELNYTPRTKAGEAFQTYSKYLYGLSGLLVGGEAAGGVEGALAAKNISGGAKLAGGISKVLKGDKFFKTAKGGLTALGVKGLNIGTQGVVQGAILDATIRDENEGRIADIFGETHNKFLDWLQTDENDSTAEAKFKNVVDGALFSIGINGVVSAAEPIIGRLLKNVKFVKQAKDSGKEISEDVIQEINKDNIKLSKIAETSDLVGTIKGIKQQAEEAGDDASEAIVHTLHPDDIEEGQKILQVLNDGEDIFVHDNGTWDIKVSTWEDAYKVSPDEYKSQLDFQDNIKAGLGAETRLGDTAIQHQDEAIKSTWTNRGWIGEGKSDLLDSKGQVSKSTAKSIVNNYTDKFGLKNKIKVEVVDGLTNNGQKVDGMTSAAYTKGKTVKDTQIPIDKKNVQIKELENKIEALGAKTDKADTKSALKELKQELPKLEYVTLSKKGGFWKRAASSPMEKAFKKGAETLNETIQTLVKNIDEPINVEALEQQLAKGLKDVPEEAQDDFYKDLYKAVDKASEYQNRLTPADKLSILKEKLRIAKKELNGFEKPNIAKDITIRIDANARNPYATLRAEIEHARDIATGEVPNQSEKHFARYKGINEGEAAVDYTYKKSVGRNKALNPDEVVEDIQPPISDDIKPQNDIEVKEPVQPEQPIVETALQESKTTDEAINAVVSGEVKISTPNDIKTVVNKTIELEPEISGSTWEAIAKDSDKLADLMVAADDYGYTKELQEAISMNDITLMDGITRKVMAVQKLSSHLGDKLALLGENPTLEQKKAIIDLIDQIGRYTKETGSASGRSLQARKFVNKAVESFGSLRLSELTKDGISELSDLLEKEIKKLNLNFTRGDVIQNKNAIMQDLLQNTDSPFVQMLLEDKTLATKFDSILEDLVKQGDITSEKLNTAFMNAITEAQYEAVYQATKLTDNPETKAKVVQKWCDAQGGMTSYYIHNLLSGVGTLAKNVISGGMNTVYFPAKKIIAGYLGGGEALSKEGWNTYKNLLSSWQESWSLCKQAFLEGDGKLSVMKDTMNMSEDEVFNGFREWKFDDSSPEGIWHSIQNFHSVMTRAMGASDEFMSQLNYRSLVRAQAIEDAEKLAKQYNITDEAVIDSMTDRLFKNAFDSDGKPTNVQALAEAKDILYQLPLNGKIFDRTTGEMTKVRNQSWVAGLAENLNQAAASNPLLKVMFPFVKTGANILQQNLEHNGLYALLSTNQRQLLMSNTREGALARSQVAFGMFSFMVGAGLAIDGKITGSAPADPKERKALFETGWKPYSIRIGDKYISYQGYEPIQTILGFAADSINVYANITSSEDDAKWEKFSQQVLSTTVNNFLDKAAFRTGLRQLAFITSPDENTEEFKKSLAQTAQGFLPNSSFIRNVSSLGKREITSPKGFYERIFNNYFNRGLGDYRRDVFGNRQDTYGLVVTNMADDNSNMPEYAELEKLSQFGFNPSEITKTITDTTLKYTSFKDPQTGRSAYDAMQEELSQTSIDGKTLQEAVRELVESEEYQDLPTGVNMNGFKYSATEATKLNAIKDIFVEYNNKALKTVISEQGDDFVDSKGRTMQEAKEEVELEKMNVSVNEALDHNLIDKLRRF